ncbi:M20/M25/M40 family metallo-hydrolase [Bdellovibrionota bacterium FG-2]
MKTPNKDPSSLLKAQIKTHLQDLMDLMKIPSISFEGFPVAEMQRSGDAVAALLKKRGLENVEIFKLPGAFPFVYGDYCHSPGKPTLLLYAHHDVQPAGNPERWTSPPFEPTLREGPGGLRLYGRGAADDKAGIVLHTAAISSFLDAGAELPVNVKVIIEGEEECGSSHLEDFLKKYRDRLDADVLVIADMGNFDIGVPALTMALRGIVGVHIEVSGLDQSVHSGSWGGPVPDPAMALSKILASLVDDQGRIAIPGVLEQVEPLSEAERREYARIPYIEEDFRKQSGMLPGAEILGGELEDGISPMVRLFRKPSLTVNAIEASSRLSAGNIINRSAWSKVTIRLVAGMDPEKVLAQLKAHLKKHTPWGMELSISGEAASPAWSTQMKGPAFEAAFAALERGYGKAPLTLGSGGSIPFVRPFSDALGGAPALLVGVEDPYTNAHGENESVGVSDFEKGCLSHIYLFEELAKRWGK